MAEAFEKDAKTYSKIRYRLSLIGIIGELVFFLLYQILGLSRLTADLSISISQSFPVQFGSYLVFFGVISYLVFLPLEFYSSFILERKFGLSSMRLSAWLIRESKKILLGGFLWLFLIQGLYAILRFVSWWPLAAAIGWVIVSVLIARIFPTVVVPMFYKTVPVDDTALSERLMKLCEKARLRVLGVFRVAIGKETRKANAALAGIGGAKRILLSDTLINNFDHEEIESVLAHELGHHHHSHIRKFLVMSGLGSWLVFCLVDIASIWWVGFFSLSGISDILGFPILMFSLSIAGLIGLPIQNAISRYFEWQSDRFALEKSFTPSAFARALRKLQALNLADPNPPKWAELMFYDHPPINQRIAFAESFLKIRPD